MEKLKMQTPDLTEQNIEKIARLFPNVITEKEDENGNMVKGIDFDLLRQALSKELAEDDDERYRLDWPGKKASILKANTPVNKTLRPVKKESVDFENTENLYIEGDNFEVLKILQESYLNKVKMIYIDPPYNTGKDFIYKDNFRQSRKEYEEEIGLYDEEGGKLFKNTDTNGQFHSDWLSMMYERLIIARDLLKEDGVIFISIDDNEVANLRKIMDEIYGEENFVTKFPRITKKAGKTTDLVAKNNDYVLCYGRSENILLNKNTFKDNEYKHSDKYIKERGKYKLSQTLDYGSIQYSPSLDYEIEIDGYVFRPGGVSLEEMNNRKSRNPSSDYCWRWSKDLFQFGFKNDFIVVKESKSGKRIYTKTYENAVISKNGGGYFIEKKERTKATSSLEFMENKYSNDNSRKDLAKLFKNKIFEYSKPVSLLKKLIEIGSSSTDIILDFFSGSATAAHAVVQLNAEDGGHRKYIMVQLPEPVDEKSDAFKDGYKTISDIGKERIRRAGKKIKKEFLEEYEAELEKLNNKNELDLDETLQAQKEELQKKIAHIKNLDTGFRVYKTDSSCMHDVYYHPSELTQEQLDMFITNIKEDRTPEDLLTQVMLDLGLELSLPIEEKTIHGNHVFFVQHNALVACFDESMDFGIVDEIAKIEPLKVVFRDAGFKDDKDRINAETRFKRLSPETQVTVI